MVASWRHGVSTVRSVALIARKGGVGKSTLALHLAVEAARRGERVALVDLDPQGSAAGWWRARERERQAGAVLAHLALVECTAAELPAVLRAARRDGLGVAMVDTAPHADEQAAAAARAADTVLIPTRPGILDLRAIDATVALVRRHRAACIVLNACPPGRGGTEAGIVAEAREALAGYRLPVAPVAVVQRAVLSHALAMGRGVAEVEPAGRAAAELAALYDAAIRGTQR